jgi:ferredoxin-NADP reductase
VTTLIKLVDIETTARQTMVFYFEKPEGFEYRAGQFADFTLIDPPETDAEGNTRAFSFVTAPYEDRLAVATRMRDTAFKRALKGLSVGSEVKLDGPYGDFTLHKSEATPAVFIIGGIGVTPVRSMIAQATYDKTAHQITLLHANRTPADEPFAADFARFADENPNFKFVPVVTDVSDKGWSGELGQIDGEKIRRYVADPTVPIYYLSGPEAMVKAMRQLLVSLDVSEDNIRTEEFTGY